MVDALQERLDRCSSLPTMPAVALKILELCQQDQLDLVEISSVIGRDPALAAKLLRTANSPMFSLRREATSILHAVNLLGVSALRTMVLSFSLVQECETGKSLGLAAYWKRSLLAAMAAREMCQGNGANPDEAFLAALLQDIGMLALARTLRREYERMLQAAGTDHDRLVELERQAYETDHAAVGAWLLRRWRVPEMLAAIVAGSHDPDAIPRADAVTRELAGIVALSGRFADVWAGIPDLAVERLEQELARQPDHLVDAGRIKRHLVETAPLMAPLFDIRLDSGEMASVLEQAQEVQVALSMRAALEVQSIHETLSRLESRTAALLAETQRDALTGVANRGHTDSYLLEVFGAAVKATRRIGIIFADVDRFKVINDTHGHAAGDAVLRSVAYEITRAVRASDFVGRYGGEEFVVILRADTCEEVLTVAGRIRANIADRPHQAGGGRTVPLTISLGCALLDPAVHREPGDLVAEADQALYRAKRNGRNRVEMNAPVPAAAAR